MLHVREAGAFGGISVSGSHGSLEWNALRFIDSEGLALRANQAAELTDLYHQGVYPRCAPRTCPTSAPTRRPSSRHLRAVTAEVDVERIRSEEFKVAVDPRGGAASSPRLRCSRPWGATCSPSTPARIRRARTRSRTRRSWRNWANSCAGRARTSDSPRTRTPIGWPLSTSTAPARHGHDRGPRHPALARAQRRPRCRQRFDQPHGGRCRGRFRMPRVPLPRGRSARDRGHEDCTARRSAARATAGRSSSRSIRAGTASPPWPSSSRRWPSPAGRLVNCGRRSRATPW